MEKGCLLACSPQLISLLFYTAAGGGWHRPQWAVSSTSIINQVNAPQACPQANLMSIFLRKKNLAKFLRLICGATVTDKIETEAMEPVHLGCIPVYVLVRVTSVGALTWQYLRFFMSTGTSPMGWRGLIHN